MRRLNLYKIPGPWTSYQSQCRRNLLCLHPLMTSSTSPFKFFFKLPFTQLPGQFMFFILWEHESDHTLALLKIIPISITFKTGEDPDIQRASSLHSQWLLPYGTKHSTHTAFCPYFTPTLSFCSSITPEQGSPLQKYGQVGQIIFYHRDVMCIVGCSLNPLVANCTPLVITTKCLWILPSVPWVASHL